MCDLGIKINNSFSFTDHILNVINKATRVLGFVIKNARIFRNIRVLRILYFALVRPILEFASTLWRPYQDYLIDSIERVQNRFFRFMAKQNNVPFNYYNHDYTTLKAMFNVPLLSQRFLYADLLFMFKVINGVISCSNLLSLFGFYVPPRPSRHSQLFQIPIIRTDYQGNSVVNRLRRLTNHYNSNIDFFGVSLNKFILELR